MRLATLTLIAALFSARTDAQVVLGRAADARGRAGGPVIALLSPGIKVSAAGESGAETQVTFEGWVDASRLGAKKDSFPATVSGRLTLRVRAQPSMKGAIVAVLQPGTGLMTIGREGTWTRIRRTAWIATTALKTNGARGAPAAAASAPPKNVAPGAKAAPAPTGADADKPVTPKGAIGVVGSTGAKFRDLPVGKIIGGINSGSTVEIVSRQAGWVRVRADGWIPENELVTGDRALSAVSAADLRADPVGLKGHVVQWDVEVMSLQIADPLRAELQRDEPYLLARGPGDEHAVLYIAVPANLLDEAKSLPPLARVSISARVRSGRSEPSGAPILDLLTISKR